MQTIELLSPAKDAAIGIEAFRHGADAVYVGAPRFSARSAAGNSVADIERMAAFGHRYGAKTYVALNTIMNDEELADAERLAWQLYEAGVDALIIQDLGLLGMHLPPIELHASTQTDNRTPEKVRLLAELGMKRVVLARELSLAQIRAIHETVDVELECFVHGALCVSVSGQCYLSAAMMGRSANRGKCAQPCRLPMDLIDASGKTIVSQKHLLSLKDMNRSASLEAMIAAGVTSLKIEGRLKDMTYVKNVTAYYRQRIDELLERHSDWCAASEGRCQYAFEPRPAASFNRGYTNYFIHGGRNVISHEEQEIWNFATPKSVGESVGEVTHVAKDSFTARLTMPLHNGDGLVVMTPEVVGFRLNKVDADTGRLYPLGGQEIVRQLRKGMELYRNSDVKFDALLQKNSADRRVGIRMRFEIDEQNACLYVEDESGNVAEAKVSAQEVVSGQEDRLSSPDVSPGFNPANKPQQENYRKQLTKLGETMFELTGFDMCVCPMPDGSNRDYFVPSSLLADLRRRAVEELENVRSASRLASRAVQERVDYMSLAKNLDANGVCPSDYRANVMNDQAKKLMAAMKMTQVERAYELQQPGEVPVMVMRHCLKYALGLCPKYSLPGTHSLLPEGEKFQEPFYLKIGDKKFLLKFGCKNDCMSEILSIFARRIEKT